MTGKTDSTLAQNILWQKHTTWWFVLLEGILLLGVGVFTLAYPDVVAPWIVLLVGIYLLYDSGLIIRANTTGAAHSASRTYQLASGGIGLITGLFLLLLLLFGNEISSATRIIFSIGLLLAGGVFLYGIIATDDKRGVRGRDIATNLIKVLVGVLFLITPPGVNLKIITFTVTFFGVVYVGYAVTLLFRAWFKTEPKYLNN